MESYKHADFVGLNSAIESFHSNDTAVTKVPKASDHMQEAEFESEKTGEPFVTTKLAVGHLFDSFTTDADFPDFRAQIPNNDYKDSLVDQISFAEESFQMNLIRVENENESDNDQFAEVTVLDSYSDE